ncbi:MAG: YceD family protein [Candidatus Accumulibacter sp.]|jgi:uncharacterized protein|nr:YceD family protein [Accumulibacter sp.]
MPRRVVIDSLAFAREGGSLHGELPVAGLARLLDALSDSGGSIVYRLRGLTGPRNEPRLFLEVDGALIVRCQRCLEGIVHPVGIRSLLELVGDEKEPTQEEIEDDAKDFLVAEKELDVVALIEEELILALPVAPRHEDCALPDAGDRLGETESVSPFAALAGLKGKLG